MTTITSDELKRKILHDPDFILTFICTNNPDAIYQNLRKYGHRIPNDPEKMKKVLSWMIKFRQEKKAFDILNVPILQENLLPGYEEVLQGINLLKNKQNARRNNE